MVDLLNEKIILDDFQKCIINYINASYGVLLVKTSEDIRFHIKMREILVYMLKEEKNSIPFFEWTLTKGFMNVEGKQEGDSPVINFIDALESTISLPSRSITIFYNYHHFLFEPKVQQLIKDLRLIYTNDNKMLIFTGPEFQIPSSLETELTMIEMPLPNKDELKDYLNEVVQGAVDEYGDDYKININNDSYVSIVDNAVGLSMVAAENAFALSIIKKKGKIDAEIIKEEKIKHLKKNNLLDVFYPKNGLSEVGGLNNLKEWLSWRKNFFDVDAKRYGLPVPKGMLLLGIPGCGKSLVGKCIAYEWNIPLLYFDLGKVFQSFMGQSEGNISKVIELAEMMAPVILLVDEIEKGFSGLKSSGITDSGVTARVIGKFLTWLNDKTSEVFVVATCNNFDSLPPEMLRKGRFDNIFFVDLPTMEERKEIFKIHLRKKRKNINRFDINKFAIESIDLTGSEIEEIINSAMFRAFSDNKREFTNEDILMEIKNICPIVKTMEEDINELRKRARGKAILANTEIIKNESKDRKRAIRIRGN